MNLKQILCARFIVFLACGLFSITALTKPSCPSTQPTLTLGGNASGASWVEEIKLKSTHYNSAKNIVLCRYTGKKYTQIIGFSKKYDGTYKIDKKYSDGKYKDNPSLGWNVRWYKKRADGSEQYLCSGAAVSPDWVVTARHCLVKLKSNEKYFVRANKLKESDSNGEKADVSSAKSLDKADLTLLRLKKPLVLRKYINIYTGKADLNGDIGQLYGWGCEKTSSCSSTGARTSLNERKVAIYEDTGDDRFLEVETVDNKIIVSGDSGGALLYNKQLVGVTSMGNRSRMGLSTDFTEPGVGTWVYNNTRLNY